MGKPFDGVPTEWAKHLRPKLKKQFWRKVRTKAKKELKDYGKNKEA
jgi:hypothetical protein